MTEVLDLLSLVVLGLLAGSLALEAFVLVPFWRTLRADDFFGLHHRVGPRLFRYFAPLTTLAVGVPIAAAFVGRESVGSSSRWAAAALSVGVLAFFPLFFKRANEAFATRSVTGAELPTALHRWAQVHAVRTAMAVAALVFASMP
jgi:Domain of unknown function (DUF1772)